MATLLIEELYSSANPIIEIEASSCRLAGQLMCTYLMKMLFLLYNVESSTEEQEQSMMDVQSSEYIFEIINQKMNLFQVSSASRTIRQRILNQPKLFFLKRDLTGPMGLVRHFPSESVNLVLDELISYELIRQGRT